MGVPAAGAAKLCEELHHNATATSNRPLERRLADLAIWYYSNIGFIPAENLSKRQLFLEKALWNQIEINALLLERLREQTGSKNLWLPAGLDVQGDIRSYR